MIHLVIGRRKRGKTTLAYYMVRKSPARAIFDPRGMVPAQDAPPWGVETETGRAPEHAFRVRNMAALEVGFDMLAQGEIRELVYTPSDDSLAHPFQVFCNELKGWVDRGATAAKPLSVLIDELGFLESSQRDNPALRRVFRSCEPEIFHVFITCHRPVDVPVNTRSIADFWEVFHCVQEHDLDVIRERCGESAARKVSQLTARSFVLFDDAEGKVTEYPDRPDASGHNPWFVELRPVTARASGTHALDGLANKPLDESKLFS